MQPLQQQAVDQLMSFMTEQMGWMPALNDGGRVYMQSDPGGMRSLGPHLGVDGPVEDGGEEYGQHADHHAHLLHLLRAEPSNAACTQVPHSTWFNCCPTLMSWPVQVL